MYRTAKQQSLMVESIESKSVFDLPGIGRARGERLVGAGIKTASELASLHKRMGRDEFESFLNKTCGRNSLWTGLTIAALDEYSDSQTNVSFTLSQPKDTMLDAFDSIPSSDEIKKAVDGQLKELSALIAVLHSNTQQYIKDNEALGMEINSNVNQMKNLSEIVDGLLARVENHAVECRTLKDEIVELDTIISTQTEELEACTETIEELREKNIALEKENDKFRLLSEKIENFESRIQHAEESFKKPNQMFIVTILAVFFIVFIKNYFDKMNDPLQLR